MVYPRHWPKAGAAPLPDGGNAGLWYAKMGGEWKNGGPEKETWFAPFKEQRPGQPTLAGHPTQIERAAQRLRDLIEKQEPPEHRCVLSLRTVERFVTGLGLSSPTETGFAWHWTLGTPYLPGAALKGIARSWARTWADSVPPDAIDRIFGPWEDLDKDPERASAGSLRFFDLIPANPVPLVVDVMTPHMGAYYQGSADDLPFAWPADWHRPSPIKFLAVAPGAEFLTGIAARQPYPVGHDPEDDIALVKTWLCEGLEWLGAGAKTAKGYGRFQVIPG